MKRTPLGLLTQRQGLRARGRRDQRLLHAVQAQQRLDTQNGDGAASRPRPLNARLSYLTHPHD
ncbi:MAG: hypothetical protein QOF25_4056 [Mycobacterium sp.]|nr:hypothetical protein [Mycobacterium sp.]